MVTRCGADSCATCEKRARHPLPCGPVNRPYLVCHGDCAFLQITGKKSCTPATTPQCHSLGPGSYPLVDSPTGQSWADAVDAADSPGISANSHPNMSCLIIMSLPSNCGCPSRIAKSLNIEIDFLNSCRTVRRADLAGIGSGNWGFSRVGSRSCAEPFRVWCRFLL